MEWDIAAGDALLLAVGTQIVNLDGSKFLYQKSNLTNQPFLAMVNTRLL
jgi:3'-phosphoadenosine 5'-phosphosulfate (PAPS) 3'-phosphatase